MMKYGLTDFAVTFSEVLKILNGRQGEPCRKDLVPTGMFCECGVPGLLEQFRPAFRNDEERDGFFLILYLEALLQTGIHCYDGNNYSRYIELVGHPIHISWHGWLGSKPQALLMNLSSIGADRQGCLMKVIHELLPVWMSEYDRRFGKGRARIVIRGLATDRDVVASGRDKNSAQMSELLISVQGALAGLE